jgi:hypothetical protein
VCYTEDSPNEGSSMNRSVTVTMGRNVGFTPLDELRWANLQEDLLDIVGEYGVPVFSGVGVWGEEAFTVHADRADGWDDSRLAQLRVDIGHLCERYEQVCAALTIGTVQFVGKGGGLVTWN